MKDLESTLRLHARGSDSPCFVLLSALPFCYLPRGSGRLDLDRDLLGLDGAADVCRGARGAGATDPRGVPGGLARSFNISSLIAANSRLVCGFSI